MTGSYGRTATLASLGPLTVGEGGSRIGLNLKVDELEEVLPHPGAVWFESCDEPEGVNSLCDGHVTAVEDAASFVPGSSDELGIEGNVDALDDADTVMTTGRETADKILNDAKAKAAAVIADAETALPDKRTQAQLVIVKMVNTDASIADVADRLGMTKAAVTKAVKSVSGAGDSDGEAELTAEDVHVYHGDAA